MTFPLHASGLIPKLPDEFLKIFLQTMHYAYEEENIKELVKIKTQHK